jgi:hypothetical protein
MLRPSLLIQVDDVELFGSSRDWIAPGISPHSYIREHFRFFTRPLLLCMVRGASSQQGARDFQPNLSFALGG